MLYAGIISRIETFVREAFLGLMLWLDSIVYWLVALVYRVFILVANARLFDFNDENTIGGITNRVYTIIGVAMIFVFAYNIILLISNPEKMNDNGETSLKGLVKNSVISISLIVLLPTIYNYMQLIQMDILESNVIGNLIMGGSNSYGSNDVRTAGTRVGLSVFQAFLFVTDRDGPNKDDPGDVVKYYSYNECKAMSEEGYPNIETVPFDLKEACDVYLERHEAAEKSNDLSQLITSDRETGVFNYICDGSMEYKFLISTAVGLLVAYLFISVTFDVAVRAVKLGVLQLIAPLPIIMRITKPHGGIFDKWFKELKDTYIMVFLRLAIIYFAVYMIDYVTGHLGSILAAVGNSSDGTAGKFELLVAQVFLIIGLLVFAKQAPKLIETLVGSISGGTWRISKKLNGEDYEFARRGAVGAGALGAGLAKTGFNTFFKKNEDGSWGTTLHLGSRDGRHEFAANFRRQVGNLPTNTIGNAYRGIRNGNVDISNIGNAIGQTTQETQNILDKRQERLDRIRENGGLFGRLGHYLPGVSELASGINQLTSISSSEGGIGEAIKEAKDNVMDRLARRLNPSDSNLESVSGVGESMRALESMMYSAGDEERNKAIHSARRTAAKKSYEGIVASERAIQKEREEEERRMTEIAKSITGQEISRQSFATRSYGAAGGGQAMDEFSKKWDKFLEKREQLDLLRQGLAGATDAQKASINAEIDKIQGEIRDLHIDSKFTGSESAIHDTTSKLKEYGKTKTSHASRRTKAEYESYMDTLSKEHAKEESEIDAAEKRSKAATEYEKMMDENGLKPEYKRMFEETWRDIQRELPRLSRADLAQAISSSGFGEMTLEQIFRKFIDGRFNEEDLMHFHSLSKAIDRMKKRAEMGNRFEGRRQKRNARQKPHDRGRN